MIEIDIGGQKIELEFELNGEEASDWTALREDGKPGLIFSAHLANWELPAICLIVPSGRTSKNPSAVQKTPR